MTEPQALDPMPEPGPEPMPEPGAGAGLRRVQRAAAALRRGGTALLDPDPAEGVGPLILLAAETASAAGLGEFTALAAGPALLLLAPSRAASLLGPQPPEGAAPVAALHLPVLTAANLQLLANPLAPQGIPPGLTREPPPAGAAAVLALAKFARLLPAVLAAPAAPATAASQRVPGVHESELAAYPDALAAAMQPVAEAAIPLEDAPDARIVAFRAAESGAEHLAIIIGTPAARPASLPAPLVRLHSACFTGDLLGSLRCDCGPQLRGAIRRMAAEGAGVLLYLAQEGRGIGLVNKLRAYALQDRGLDTLDANRALGWEPDERRFRIAATLLERLGIKRVRLLTNNPAKVAGLAACGIEVAGRESHVVPPNGVNDRYLATKAARFGHLLG